VHNFLSFRNTKLFFLFSSIEEEKMYAISRFPPPPLDIKEKILLFLYPPLQIDIDEARCCSDTREEEGSSPPPPFFVEEVNGIIPFFLEGIRKGLRLITKKRVVDLFYPPPPRL